jgi:hypothetical protein
MSVATFFAIAARAARPRRGRTHRHLGGERARGGDARRHVGELVARDLEPHERFAEGLSLSGVGDRLAVRELGDGDALRREEDALAREVHHDGT